MQSSHLIIVLNCPANRQTSATRAIISNNYFSELPCKQANGRPLVQSSQLIIVLNCPANRQTDVIGAIMTVNLCFKLVCKHASSSNLCKHLIWFLLPIGLQTCKQQLLVQTYKFILVLNWSANRQTQNGAARWPEECSSLSGKPANGSHWCKLSGIG